MTRTIRVVGCGMGPQHVTPEAATALAASAYVVAASKSDDDPLLEVRRAIAAAHGLDVLPVADPPRDRTPSDYVGEVASWHAARAAGWTTAIEARDGDPAFLVWGDPAFYDSTIRVVGDVAAALDARIEVVAGVSTPSLLAARFGIVLHDVGQPVHVTTERRLADSLASGQRNVLVMLTSQPPVDVPGDWTIWWGANLGAPTETLVHGALDDVLTEITAARARVKAEAGWVMDAYLVRSPA